MRLNVHVRGESLLGGAQKLRGLEVSSVEDLISVLERELRPLHHSRGVLVDSLRYFDAEFGDYVLLEDISDLPPDRARLELVAPPAAPPAAPPGPASRHASAVGNGARAGGSYPRPLRLAPHESAAASAAAAVEAEREARRLREDRAALRQELELLRREQEAAESQRMDILRLVAAFVQLLQRLVPSAVEWGEADAQRVVDVFRRVTPSLPLFGQLREEDAAAADELLRRVVQAPAPPQGVLRLRAALGDALSDLATVLCDQVAKATANAVYDAGRKQGRAQHSPEETLSGGATPPPQRAEDRWASPPPPPPPPPPPSSPPPPPPPQPPPPPPGEPPVLDERVVHAQLADSKRVKVVRVNAAGVAPLASLRQQLEAKTRAPPGSLRFAYCDDDGFSWEVDDDESLLEFLARYPPGLGGDRRRAQLTVYRTQPAPPPPPTRAECPVSVDEETRAALTAEDVSGALLCDEQWRAKWTEYLGRFDVSCSGTLSRGELCGLLRQESSLGWLDDESLRPPGAKARGSFLESKVDSILLQLDPAHDGKVTYDEFCLVMLKLSQV